MKATIAAAVATFLFSAAALPASATATTLFQSLPNVASGAFTATLVNLPNSYNNSFRVYDQFTLSAAATITAADFLVYWNNVPLTGELSVYSVSNGVAGTRLFSEMVSTSTVTAVNDPNSMVSLARITADPTDFKLDAGTYSISLAGVDYKPFSIATFSLSDAANPVTASAFSYQSGTGPMNGVGGYAVYGTAAAPAAVPEPAALALFGLGAACAFAARRRRA